MYKGFQIHSSKKPEEPKMFLEKLKQEHLIQRLLPKQEKELKFRKIGNPITKLFKNDVGICSIEKHGKKTNVIINEKEKNSMIETFFHKSFQDIVEKASLQKHVSEGAFKIHVKPGRTRKFDVTYSSSFPPIVHTKPGRYRICLSFPKELNSLLIEPYLDLEGNENVVIDNGISVQTVSNRRVKMQLSQGDDKQIEKFSIGFNKTSKSLKNRLRLCFRDKETGIVLCRSNYFEAFCRKKEEEEEFWKGLMVPGSDLKRKQKKIKKIQMK